MSQMTFDLNSKTNKTSKSDSPKILSVSELNREIKGVIESSFPKVWVQGEISNFTAHSSGHFYFSLKDKNAQISAVMFRGQNAKLKFKPKVGMEVVVKGKITVYEPRGNYQLFCEQMEPLGAGALQIAFDQLKQKLHSEGLFSEDNKKELPEFPKTIALVTSPTGAAVRDMLQVLERRFKAVNIIVVPAVVQGTQAAASIVEAMNKANKIKSVDVIIVGRGGGSMEDLWCFNEEVVARAIFNSVKPTISAVGHEVDFTIADFVADLRAPTPSAAAELVVRNSQEIVSHIISLQKRLLRSVRGLIEQYRINIDQKKKRMIDPQRALQDSAIRCDELRLRLERAMQRGLQDQRNKLTSLMNLLNSLSPLSILDRGYSIVSKDNDEFVTSASQIKPKEELSVRLAKGNMQVIVKSKQELKGE